MSDHPRVLRDLEFYSFGPTLHPPHPSWRITCLEPAPIGTAARVSAQTWLDRRMHDFADSLGPEVGAAYRRDCLLRRDNERWARYRREAMFEARLALSVHHPSNSVVLGAIGS